MPPKTVCPISRAEFLAKAQPLAIEIAGQKYVAAAREFSTGSLGWNVNQKMTIMVDGKPITVQIGLNVTVVGSKELPKTPGAAAPAPAPEEKKDEA